jgi:Ca-activated chloride channel family protein
MGRCRRRSCGAALTAFRYDDAMRRTLPLAAMLALASAAAVAQTQPPLRDHRTFRSGIELTSIAATVTDRDGRLITDLPREAFEVFEDGERQVVTQFIHDRVSVGLGVLLDISDSMFGKRIRDARTAVDRFLFQLLDPADEFFLMAFNHRPRPLTGWTRAQDDVRRALDGLRPTGGTAIYDAIFEALPIVDRRTRQRAALLVISDGADTASSATLRELRSALLRSDTFVYAIAIDSADPRAINTRINAEALREITAETGGRTEIVRTSEEMIDACQRIADELNSQYILGYTSSKAGDGKYHSIRVRIAGTEHRVRALIGDVATPN